MSITHHPGEELLLSYALGASSEPVALLVATHLSVCSACRESVKDMEAAGGAMLTTVEPAPMSDSALRSVWSRLDEKPLQRPIVAGSPSDVPPPLRAYVGDEFAKARWIPVAPGLAHLPLVTRGGARARLIRARPGAGVAVHTHRGEEWTMVLTGSYHTTRPVDICPAMCKRQRRWCCTSLRRTKARSASIWRSPMRPLFFRGYCPRSWARFSASDARGLVLGFPPRPRRTPWKRRVLEKPD